MDQEKFDKARQLKEQIKFKTEQINMINGLLRSKLSKTVEVRGYNGMVAYLSGYTPNQIGEMLESQIYIVQDEVAQLQAEFDQL